MKSYDVAVVGATGMVGQKMLEVLAERNFPINNLYPFASAKSAGKTIDYCGKKIQILELNEENIKKTKPQIALFSAGASVSKTFAPIFVSCGSVVIDNSSCFRQDSDIPLVVPEVNSADIFKHNGIIANPNCSTIQAVVALKPLHDKFKIKRIVYSTYQAVSGAGIAGKEDLEQGISGNAPKKFPCPIAFNVIPHIDVFLEDGYTKEEKKMIDETKKILGDYSLKITATTVRVPVYNAHSESINIEFHKPVTKKQAIEVLSASPNIIVMDDNNIYPTPLTAQGHDEVYVGRIREDHSVKNGLNLWVVADNIRKGAATNAVQIAQKLIDANK